MPTIPRYNAQGSLSGKSENAYIENPEFITSSLKTGTGEAVTDLGKVGMAFAHAKQMQELSDLTTQLHMDRDATASSFAERSDYGNFDNDLKASQEKRLQQYREAYPNAYRQLEKKIGLSLEEERIKISGMGRRLMAQDMESKWDDAISNKYPQLLANTDDPAEREAILADARAITDNGVRALYINPVKAGKKIRELGSKADFIKFKREAQVAVSQEDLDAVQVKLAMQEYPNMSVEDEDKAYALLDRRGRQIEIEGARQQRETFKQGAQQAYDNMRLWKQGKFPGYEDWLDKNRGVTISEQTYQAGMNKIEHAKNRAAMNPKLSGAQKEKYYALKERILLGDPTVTQDDIMKGNFPDGKENALMDLIIKPKAVKTQIGITNRRIEGTLREAEVDEKTKEGIRTDFANRVQGVSEPDEIRKIGEDVIKSVPQSGWGKPRTPGATPSKPSASKPQAQSPAPTGMMINNGQGGFTFKKGK